MSADDHHTALYELSRTLHQQGLDIHKTLQIAGCHHGCLMTFRDDEIDNAYVIGLSDEETKQDGLDVWNLLLTHGVVGFVHHGQRTVVVRNIQTDPRWPQIPAASIIPQQGSAIGLPLHKDDYVYGVMLFIHDQVDYFTEARVELLEEVGDIATAAIGNALDYLDARSHNAHYQALFDDAIAPIILTDLYGYILDVNRKTCEILGYDRGDLLRLPISRIHRLDDVEIRMEDGGMLQRDEEFAFRTVVFRSDGEEMPVIVRARRLLLDERDVIEWVEQDITAQMELEHLRRDLSAMVYHDLRGPLHNIKASIYKLNELIRNPDHQAVPTLLNVALQSTSQLQQMVDSLLDIQRLENGNAILDRKVTPLKLVLGNAVQLVKPLAMEGQQHLEMKSNGNLPQVCIDSNMIIRVVINLIENAIKYTPEGGTILVRAVTDENEARVSVRDSGPGIPQDKLHTVFDKFSRVKYKDVPQGVGLGLAFCRLAVEAHGGRIWVESEEGKGSEFFFTLPVETPAVGDDTQSRRALA